jgi:hypothetical protein
LEKEKMKLVWKNTWNLPKNWTSDIFSFKWDTTEIEYIRQN